MSDSTPATTPPAPRDDAAGAFDMRSLVIAGYVLFLLAWMNGITAIIGVVLAYVKRSEAAGTIWHSHFDNLILVFWVLVVGFVLGLFSWPLAFGLFLAQSPVFWPATLSLPFVVGFLVFPVLVFWSLYRMIRGLIRALEGRPY